MKTRSYTAVLFCLGLCLWLGQSAAAQTAPDPFVTAMNSAWQAKNYETIRTTLEAALLERPNDLIVLSAARTYYLMISPNVSQYVSTVNKIKTVADSSNNAKLKDYANELQGGLAAIVQQGMAPLEQATMDRLHAKFHSEYPLMWFGIKLQSSLQ